MKNLFITLLLATLSLSALAQHHEHGHSGHTDRPSVHGMFLMGTDTIYLSHLPMFHTPHDYQVIFEVKLPKAIHERYLAIKKDAPEQTVYTLVPEVFVLPDMALSPRPFKAQIFFGHFERGGQPISNEITVEVKKVIYFQKFTPDGFHPEKVEYILFGNKKEIFGAHTINVKPDFDHIIEIENTDYSQSVINSKDFAKITFPSSKKQTPLEAKKTYSAVPVDENSESGVGMIKTKTSLYLEFGDLSF